jgi:hypothetical protein
MKELIERFLEHLRVKRLRPHPSELRLRPGTVQKLSLVRRVHRDEKRRCQVENRSPGDPRLPEPVCTGNIKSPPWPENWPPREVFRYLVDEGVMKRSPAEIVTTPKQEKNLPSFLPVDEMFAWWKSRPRRPLGARDRAILETLYSCGIRVARLVGLSDGDVDENREFSGFTGREERKDRPHRKEGDQALQAYLPRRDEVLARRKNQGRAPPVHQPRDRLTARAWGESCKSTS